MAYRIRHHSMESKMPETAKPASAPKNIGGRPRKNPSETEWKAHLVSFTDLQARISALEERSSDQAFIDMMIAFRAAAGNGLPKPKLMSEFVAYALEAREMSRALLGG